ncbi:hypothetical protein D9757_009426 [Collybiopsis confluens]|uniref:F-box domain-containing protein n=1 Tax=Collybiopsis confluens TaxID=2823264 RepID=A0A8H5M4R8_9AGAR|nr:hypothetical protein D9757_009426 [Collybiopsis confluens]
MDNSNLHKYATPPRRYLAQYTAKLQKPLRTLQEEERNGYNDEILRLEKQISSLKDRRDEVISPIHRLPNEILSQIFPGVCDNIDTRYAIERCGISTPPFWLSAVCYRWRSLCLADSRLWATLVINCGKKQDIRTAELLDLFIERSKQQPLRLNIVCFDDHPSVTLVHRLTVCSSRWKDLTLTLEGLSSLSSELQRLPFPVLESLNIQGVKDGGDLGIFSHVPKLKTLSVFESLTIDRTILGQITDSDLACYAGTTVLTALGMCSNLRTLDIYTIGRRTTGHMRPIVIPTLTSLSVTSKVPDDEVLRFITAPALTSLTLKQLCREEPRT